MKFAEKKIVQNMIKIKNFIELRRNVYTYLQIVY